ncbi:hypothetical protein [Sphingomonas sp. NFR04]|uniref:hypothetical protein n=1 Tax=Sphingomonas sp. NFR04 TaxID=1566283 RepID=UPI001113E9A5|nr:hypothetical protein [Sphingomonas sp. NFR04]
MATASTIGERLNVPAQDTALSDQIDTAQLADIVSRAVNEPSAPFFGAFKARSPHALGDRALLYRLPDISFA